MRNIVKVTRRGQTTIPAEFRKRFGIKEGDELIWEHTEAGLLLKAFPKLEESAGIDAGFGRVEEIKRQVEKLREEY